MNLREWKLSLLGTGSRTVRLETQGIRASSTGGSRTGSRRPSSFGGWTP